MNLKKIVIFTMLALTAAVLPNTHANAGLFGSRERESRNIGEFPKWTNMLARFISEDSKCGQNSCNIGEWDRFIKAQRGNPDKLAVLKAVNRFVNEVRYVDDSVAWKEDDYWQTPYQFFSRGGDCEDFATAKFVTLLKLGFKNEDMRIVVLKDTRVNLIHAVLIVNIDGESYMLDNRIPIVTTDRDVKYYRPIYSINETNWWRHS